MRISDALQRHVDQGTHFGAGVLVAHGGNVIHQATVGNAAPHRALQPTDKYMLLSMSRIFTAVLALRAVQAGWYDLTTKVEELVPGFGTKGKEEATVEHLLTNMAGLPSAVVAPPLCLQALGDLDQTVAATNELDAVYSPGEGCVYTSGPGYDVLGQILVNTDPQGRPFHVIADEELFKPLGLMDTTFGLPLTDPRRVPVQYVPSVKTPFTNIFSDVINSLDEHTVSPSHGASSTLQEMFTLSEMLAGRGPSLLSPDLLSRSKQIHSGEHPFITMPAMDKASVIAQLRNTMGLWGMFRTGRKNSKRNLEEEEQIFPGNFNLLGGSCRGVHDETTSLGRLASPSSFGIQASGSFSLLHDPDRDLSVVFMAAGVLDGNVHATKHVSEINDLVLAAFQN